jgi:hypothetical protein
VNPEGRTSVWVVNLEAELEIRQLQEKVDHRLTRQWKQLFEIQQVQEVNASARRPG